MAKLKLVSLKKDTKVWENIKKNILKGSNPTLDVGFFETAPEYENGLSVAQVAQYQEEGIGVPMRSFIRGGFMLTAPKMYNAYFQQAMQRIASGKSSFTKEYSMIGPLMKADMQEIIEEWDTPPNSPLTIAIKGRDDPLVDSSLMRDSVDFRVGTKNGE